jgi:hypothetical protein
MRSEHSRRFSYLVRASSLAACTLLATFLGACNDEQRAAPASGAGPNVSGIVSAGTACTDGAVRQCSRILESDDPEVLHCLKAEQTCHDGVWSPCGEEGAALFSRKVNPSRGLGPGARTLSLSSPTSHVGNCDTDPCNDGCMGFNEEPASPLTGAGSNVIYVNPSEWGNSPVGFTSKQDCSSTCASGYPKNCSGTPEHQNQFDGCLADHHCNAGSGECVRNWAGWTWSTSVCAGVDLTVGPWCTRYSGATVIDAGFPVCNRGNTALASGSVIKVAIKNGNWLDFNPSTVSVSGAQFCNLTLASALQPGSCARITSTTCDVTGNAVAYINYDGSIAECGYPEPAALDTATSPGRSNNWSDIKPGSNACIALSSATTLVHVEDYVAQCGYNETPQWDRLTFDSTTQCSPSICDGTNGSSIKFEAQTSDDGTNFTSKTTVADAPSVQAAACSLSGPTPNCPVDLGGTLGKVDREKGTLRLTMTLTPSPDQQVAPVLNDWQVTYRCIPSD